MNLLKTFKTLGSPSLKKKIYALGQKIGKGGQEQSTEVL